ncbi:ribonuclease PH [Kiritimatiellaeota bacterium B1221]|nr:ribonuclease PH [Kiritimatiellaeota bacterium B1221]
MEANSFDALRSDLRKNDQLRPVTIQKNIAPAATGSCLISFGKTQVICAVNIEDKIPGWMRYQKVSGGWLTAEYSMLPYSTEERSRRPGANPNGRSIEIQRLIGRSLRASVDLLKLGPKTITIDCDVLNADGGTRTASITGAYVALVLAIRKLQKEGKLKKDPLTEQVAAISVGIVKGVPMLDLCYEEDFAASTDANTVMTASGNFIEVQSTAEEGTYSREELNAMLDIAEKGNKELMAMQLAALNE